MSTPRPPRSERALRVLFVASECAPSAKCGGLGDVVASLSKALRLRGIDARVLLPLYRTIDRARHGLRPDARDEDAPPEAFLDLARALN